MLKLLFAADTRKLLGVHIFGERGDRARAHRPGGDRPRRHDRLLRDTVFNYPTMAEAYKVAALDAMNRLNELSVARKVA